MKNNSTIINQATAFRKLLTSGGLTFMYRIGGLLFSFLITFFITKNYGESIYGNYALIFTLLQASTMIFALGLPNALISYLGLHEIDGHFSQFILKKGLKILLLTAILPSILYYFLSTEIAISIFNNEKLIVYIKIIALTLPFSIFHEFILSFFIATRNFVKFNIFMFIVPNLFFLILLLIFSISEENQWYTILFYSISIGFTVITALFFAVKKHQKEQLETISSKQMIQFSSPMMLSSLMLFLLNWTDVFMLGAMVSDAQLGIYNLAYKLASLGMLVIISMNVVLAPKIAELYKLNQISELHKTIKNATRVVILLTLPVIVVMLVFSDFILGLFGDSFIQGKMAFIIITVGVFLNVITGNVDQILNMTNNQKVLRNCTIFGFALNVVLNYFLIPKYGIVGAAIASMFTNVIFNVTCLFFIKKRLGFYTFI
ncbi:flippase [Flavobacterium sp. CAN_S2]|uniref:flippase n=1 Tax=Flavobacterium sp. CAN_S2 TaxID=2787726 RepID=UPI0018CAADF0